MSNQGSIRDMFAAAALKGMLASAKFCPRCMLSNHHHAIEDIIAGYAYDYADAMMVERAKREENNRKKDLHGEPFSEVEFSLGRKTDSDS